jgi:tetratricopeptide (TPR) repeat protein
MALAFAKGSRDEAIAAGRKAVELAPHQADAFYALGIAHDMGRRAHAEAERCYRQALALDPQHAASLNALSRRHLRSSGFGRAGNLATAAEGFREAVRADPRLNVAATNLELVLRVFIARLSYLIFIIALLASPSQRGFLGSRLAPFLLLAIPVAFAIRFLWRLAPDLRRHVGYVAFHGRLAVPSVLQSCAVVLLLVSVVVQEGARKQIGFAAVMTSLAARIVLAVDTWRRRRRATR